MSFRNYVKMQKNDDVKKNQVNDLYNEYWDSVFYTDENISRFKNLEAEKDRKRTDKSFMVSKKEIADNDYDLSINKYKEVEYVAVEYSPTSEIMANIREIEKQISQEMDELEMLLSK